MKQAIFVVIVAILATHSMADFASDCVTAHNSYRTPLNISPLTWSADIARSAQAWANKLAAQGDLVHSDSKYGENLASRTGRYTPDAGSDNSNTGADSPSTEPENNNQGSDSSNSNPEPEDNNAGQNAPQDNSENSDNNNNENQGSQGESHHNWGHESEQENSDNHSDENGEESYYEEEEEEENNNNGNGNEDGASDSEDCNKEESDDSQNADGGNGDDFKGRDRSSEDNSDGGNHRRRHRHRGNRRLASSSGTALVNKLIGQWGDEKKYFVYGTYPDVSNGGGKVGHYTQMVWGETKQVGCGIANGNGWVYLVCQYDPAGNMRGDPVY